MALLEAKQIPMSVSGVRRAAKDIVGKGVGAAFTVAGIGAFVLALPLIARVPLLNRATAAGLSFVKPNDAGDDGFGGL